MNSISSCSDAGTEGLPQDRQNSAKILWAALYVLPVLAAVLESQSSLATTFNRQTFSLVDSEPIDPTTRGESCLAATPLMEPFEVVPASGCEIWHH